MKKKRHIIGQPKEIKSNSQKAFDLFSWNLSDLKCCYATMAK